MIQLRRQYLRDALRDALLLRRFFDQTFDTSGLLHIKTPNEFAIWLTTRPPELSDFHNVDTRKKPSEMGVVIGPSKYLESDRRIRLNWLSSISNIYSYDEGELIQCEKRANKYSRYPNAALYIEEAVTSLARAVFAAEGTLVFGGHPTISPLVAQIAGEYISPRYVEKDNDTSMQSEDEQQDQPRVIVYQSKAFEGYLPDETWLLHRLGYAKIEWVEAVGDERFNPEAIQSGKPQCRKSLKEMRTRMINETDPVCMVCIGGMEGVEDEAYLFNDLKPECPIFVLQTTGGAAALLAEHNQLRVIDRELLDQLEGLRNEILQRREEDTSKQYPPEDEFQFTPYALIMQRMIAELGCGGESNLVH